MCVRVCKREGVNYIFPFGIALMCTMIMLEVKGHCKVVSALNLKIYKPLGHALQILKIIKNPPLCLTQKQYNPLFL